MVRVCTNFFHLVFMLGFTSSQSHILTFNTRKNVQSEKDIEPCFEILSLISADYGIFGSFFLFFCFIFFSFFCMMGKGFISTFLFYLFILTPKIHPCPEAVLLCEIMEFIPFEKCFVFLSM